MVREVPDAVSFPEERMSDESNPSSVGGRPEVLELRELPDPVPQAGEVLVRVHTSGVNFIDVYHREGKYNVSLPFIPGGEGSGYVDALGEGVTDFALGDPVAWWGPLGSYAEKTVVASKTLVKVPSGVERRSIDDARRHGLLLEPSDIALKLKYQGGVRPTWIEYVGGEPDVLVRETDQ